MKSVNGIEVESSLAVAAASIKGLIICFTLRWIIFGAIVLLTTLRKSGAPALNRKRI